MSDELPERWQQVRLGEIVKPGYGKALDKSLRKDVGRYPVVGSAGLMAYSDSALVEGEVLVVGRKGNVGEVQVFRDGVWPIDTAYFLKPPQSVDIGYLYHFLVAQEMKKLDSSTTTPSLRREDLEAVNLRIPCVEEQREIVRILEEQLSRLDAAAASIAAVRRKADQFRRSLLHAAFAGSLTGGKAAWTTSSLEEVLDASIGGVWGDEAGVSEVDVDVVRVTELRPHGVVDVSTAVRRSVTKKQLDSRALRMDDLLLEKSGGGPNTPVGRVGRVPKIEWPTVCSNFMQLMRPNTTKVRAAFLHHFLVLFHADGQTIPLQTSTTNIRNIKTKEYLKTEVPVPPLSAQDEVLRVLESHLARLEIVLTEAEILEKKIVALRRSLLHSAFSGGLTREWREKNNG